MIKAQLSAVKDLPVEGDVETWANRADKRAVFSNADVDAVAKLGDDRKADVWGGYDKAECVKDNDKTEREKTNRAFPVNRKETKKSKAPLLRAVSRRKRWIWMATMTRGRCLTRGKQLGDKC